MITMIPSIVFIGIAVVFLVVVAAGIILVMHLRVYQNKALERETLSADGYAVFRISAGGSAQDTTIYVRNNAIQGLRDVAQMFIPSKTSDTREQIKRQGCPVVKVLPDGASLPEKLRAGNYTAYLLNGDGGRMETQQFVVSGGYTTTVIFIGMAPGGGGGGCGG